MTTPHPFDHKLDLAPFEPLSPSARDAREAMLEPLRARLAARRRRRLAVRAGAACVLTIAALVGLRLLTTPTPSVTPSHETAHQTPPAPPVAPSAPRLTTEQPKKFAITIINTDPTVLDRLSAKLPALSIVKSLTDDELLDALQAAGTPGLIKINGKVVLSRDLFKPADSNTQPQSLLHPKDRTHG